tara:strand:- start:18408 stop:18995 length:588 start_codon:yes stop_codon:yes gene_type:complete
MQEKGRFLRKINIFLFCILFCGNTYGEDLSSKIIDYNNSLQNTSALFIQSGSETIEEGVIYFGKKRIRVEYKDPTKLTLIFSAKKGIYINHDLKESQFFNTKKSYVSVFFKIFNKDYFLDKPNIKITKNLIQLSETAEIDGIVYTIQIVYEINPIKLRKILIFEQNKILELGFFDHKFVKEFDKKFFSMIDPYIN